MSALLRQPTAENVEKLNGLVDRALFLDAWDYAKELAPLPEWTEANARHLAGRLADYWGSQTLGRKIQKSFYRAFPRDLTAILDTAFDRTRWHGPFEGWRFLNENTPKDLGGYSPRELARLWGWKAVLLANFHDFEGAQHWLGEAIRLNPADPWIWVDSATVREKQDDYGAALVDLEEALKVQSNYRAAIEQKSRLLRLLNRDEEAHLLLVNAVQTTQNAQAAQLLMLLEMDKGRHMEAWQSLDLVERYLPMPDPPHRKWTSQQRATLAYYLGRDAEAIVHARAVGERYFDVFADRLAAPVNQSQRVILEVGFVRQHHQTCAPATMAAIGGFWGRPVDHLAVAKVITYDGTPDHEERYWVESNGWFSREFRVTWDAAVALIDRGCPFTLTTVYSQSAHLQAVVGYDARLRTLIIRDPYWRNHSEMLADDFLKNAESNGPRGHVFLPVEKKSVIEDLALPDEAEYNLFYRLRRALSEHRRGEAETLVASLLEKNAGHHLGLWARRELAAYDGNLLALLEYSRELSTRFPDAPNYHLDEIRALRALGRNLELKEKLSTCATRMGGDPVLWRFQIEEERGDASRLKRNLLVTQRLLRRQPVDGANLHLYADLLWTEADFSQATDVYRLAACCDEAKEHHWQSYFGASRIAGRTEESLQLLRSRYSRLGERSGIPTRNLVDALLWLNRHTEGQGILAEALVARPADGELMVYAAQLHAFRGEYGEAGSLLGRSRPHANHGTWLRAAAQIARLELDFSKALELWRNLLALNPVDREAHGEIAKLLAILNGNSAATEYLEAERLRLPNFMPLLQLQVEWQRSGDVTKALATLAQYLEIAPRDAWGWREKAILLSKTGQYDSAYAAAETAVTLEPKNLHSLGILAHISGKQRRLSEARATYETAIRLQVDADWLMPALFEACANGAERRQALEFVYAEMRRQHLVGGSVRRLLELSRGFVRGEEFAGWLAEIEKLHPDEWQVGAARIAHTLELGQRSGALSLADENVIRFRSVPEIWLELASCRDLNGDSAGALAAMEQAHKLLPNAAEPILRLAQLSEKQLRFEQALEWCRLAVRANPLEAVPQARLGDILWKTGQRDGALAAMKRAIKIVPGYEWAWARLHEWHVELQRPTETIKFSEELAMIRPGDVDAWLQRARICLWQGNNPGALEAVDHALKLDPFRVNAYEVRAEVLAYLGRFPEALAACHQELFGPLMPRELRGRQAWIEARQGNHVAAIKLMDKLLAEQPDYYWGWSTLAEWHDANGETHLALAAAKRMAELAPQVPQGWGYIGKLEKMVGKRPQAKEAFAEAVRCDPDYYFGSSQLFRMHLEDREFEKAKQILDAIQRHSGPEHALRCEVRLAVALRDKDKAMHCIEALLRTSHHFSFALRETVSVALQEGWNKEVDELLCRALADERVNPAAGALWVDSWFGQRSLWLRLRALQAPPESERWAQVYGSILDQLAKTRSTWTLRLILLVRGKSLRIHALTWGQVSYALANLGQHAALIRWGHDGLSRKDLQPWMLLNLADALVEKGKLQIAREVIVRSGELPPDHATGCLQIWLAYLQMLAGETVAAREILNRFHATGMTQFFQYLHGLASAGVKVQEANPVQRTDALREAKNLIEDCRDRCSGSRVTSFHLRLYRRTIRRMGLDAADWRTRLESFNPLVYRPRSIGISSASGASLFLFVMIFSQAARTCSENQNRTPITSTNSLPSLTSASRFAPSGSNFSPNSFGRVQTSQSVRIYINLGNAQRLKGDILGAIAYYDSAIGLDQSSGAAYLNRGMAKLDKGDTKAAIADFERTIFLDPEGPTASVAYFSRGFGYIYVGDYGRALADFDEAIRLNPKAHEAYFGRSLVYHGQGDYQRAVSEGKEVLRLNPDHIRVNNHLAWILATCPDAAVRDGVEALKFATKACELEGWKEPKGIDTLAAAYAEIENFTEAIKWENKYLEFPLPANKAEAGRQRLTLYQNRRPYREEKR